MNLEKNESNTQKIEKIRQKNIEENRKNNIALKQQLKNISSQIEEIFAQEEKKIIINFKIVWKNQIK